MEEEVLPLEKIQAIKEQLIGFIYNGIVFKEEEFYYDGHNVQVPFKDKDNSL